jgi:hypothetical protein
MGNSQNLNEWSFRFGLCVTNERDLIPRDHCDELMELIIEWAESKNYGVGGGFGPFGDEEQEPIDPRK